MAPAQQFAIRRQVIEYGSIPTASWLHHIDGTAAISHALARMLEAGVADAGRCLVDTDTLARCLEVPQQHAKVLADMLDAVTDPHHNLVTRPPGRAEAGAVDAHALALFLFAQLYTRQAQRPEALEVWPATGAGPDEAAPMHIASGSGAGGGGGNGQMPELHAPVSPARSNSSTSSQGSARHLPGVHFQQQKSNHLVRRELQAHLHQHAALLHGYTEHLRRHAHALLSLALDRPLVGGHEGSFQGAGARVRAAEFDRLAFLLRALAGPQQPQQPQPLQPADSGSDSGAGAGPMDTGPSPLPEDGWRLSLAVPLFASPAPSAEAPFAAVAEWLAGSIAEEALQEETVLGASPRKGSPCSAGLPLAGVVQGEMVDIQGVCKSTVVRGEEDFPSGSLRVTDCHDSVVYALAPLQYAAVISCSDCTVVVGAVARALRVERCERLTLIAAAVRVCVGSCHECTLYLGVNRPPLLIGDNRALQVAPYNTQYERLPVHLAAAGVDTGQNFWDQPVSLALPHRPAAPDGGGARPAWGLLPPERLLPFMVPFQGGRGPLCGGAASGGVTRLAADLGSFVGLGDAPTPTAAAVGPLPASPFRLPGAYAEAKERKVAAVSELRHHIKSAVLDEAKKRELQASIQAHFKEWLTSTGLMRQVYDLARMEREEGAPPPASPRGPSPS